MSHRPPAQQEQQQEQQESDKTVASPLTPRHHERSFARTTRTRKSKLDFPVGGILTEAPHPQPQISRAGERGRIMNRSFSPGKRAKKLSRLGGTCTVPAAEFKVSPRGSRAAKWWPGGSGLN